MTHLVRSASELSRLEVSFSVTMAESAPQKPQNPEPKGFVEDIVAAILNPGYIGFASLMIINVALVLVAFLIALRVFTDPRGLSELENSIHLFALIPCIGLLLSINWYAWMVSTLPASEKGAGQSSEGQKDQQKKKNKKKKAD